MPASRYTGLLALASQPPGPSAGGDAASAADSGEALAAALSSPDTASAAEAGEKAALGSPDTVSAGDSGGLVLGSVQAAQVNSAVSVTSQAAALPAGVTQGNLVVACLAAGNNATSVTPPDASWHQAVLNQPAGASATIEAGIWYLVVDAAHAGQSSWTWTFGASHTVYIVTREWYCSAGWPASPVDVTAQGDTAVTPAAGTAVSSGTTAVSSAAPELEVAALAYKGTAQAETGLSAGWSQGLEATLAANNTLREAYRVSSAAEAASASLSVGTAQFWAGAVAVFAAGRAGPSDSDAASAAEAGERVSLGSPDTASAAEAGEKVSVSSADASPAGDAGEKLALSSPDAAGAAEGSGPLALASADASAGADSGEKVSVSSAEAAGAAEVSGSLALSAPDTAGAADGGEKLALSSAEAASAGDSGEKVSLASADASAGADSGEKASLSSADAAGAADGGGPASASLSSPDTASAADAGEAAASLGSSGPPVLTRQPGAAWAARYGPPGRARPQFLVPAALPPGPPAVTDSDSARAEESGFSALASPEAASASDGGEAVTVTSAEDARVAEAEGSSWPQDRDAASAAEAQHWSGPLADPAPEAVRGADGGEALALASAEAASAADEGPVVDVYSFQPPFRWTGGGYQLRRAGRLVWSGDRPDAAALRLWKTLSESREVRFAHDADAAAAAEETGPPPVSASVSVRAAVTLTVRAG